MNQQKAGQVSDIAKDNVPVPGCTISNQLYDNEGVTVLAFSLAKDTSISAESYSYYKIWTVVNGQMEVFDNDDHSTTLSKGQSYITDLNVPVGVKTSQGCTYTEVNLKKGAKLNPILSTGKAFKIVDIVPYQAGKIINSDLVVNDMMKFVVMSFDNGLGLAEHSAPGEAMIFGLDGKGTITYEGEDHLITTGETFRMAKGARHAVHANSKFKMALLVMTK